MMKALILSLLMLTAPIAQLCAQDSRLPPGKWWEIPRVVEFLHLSEQQQEKIDALVYEHARKMIGLNAGLEESRLALAQQVDSKNFDPSKVRAGFETFQNARKKLETERFEMLLAVRQVLSAEQWDQLGVLRRRLEGAKKRGEGQHPPRPGNFRPGARGPGAQGHPGTRGPRP